MRLRQVHVRFEVAGVQIRSAFRADPRPGYTGGRQHALVVADYGQLELRILAHMADCRSMKEAFRLGGDFHSRTALGMYDHIQAAIAKGAPQSSAQAAPTGLKQPDVARAGSWTHFSSTRLHGASVPCPGRPWPLLRAPAHAGDCLLEWGGGQSGKEPAPVPLLKDMFANERKKAKILNFSIAYGKTAHGLSKDWGVSMEEAEETVARWYADRPEVRTCPFTPTTPCRAEPRTGHPAASWSSTWRAGPPPGRTAGRLRLLHWAPTVPVPADGLAWLAVGKKPACAGEALAGRAAGRGCRAGPCAHHHGQARPLPGTLAG